MALMWTYPKSWDQPYTPPPGLSEPLRSVVVASFDRVLAMSPAQKQAMHEAQRESFIRAMQPCEHGDPDWETCTECRTKYTPPLTPIPLDRE